MLDFKHLYRIYCGPGLVDSVANRLSREYLNVKTVGTAHVYVETNYDIQIVLNILGRTGWSLRDIQDIRAS